MTSEGDSPMDQKLPPEEANGQSVVSLSALVEPGALAEVRAKIEKLTDDELCAVCILTHVGFELAREQKESEERWREKWDGLCFFGCGEAVDHDLDECPAFQAEMAAARKRGEQLKVHEAVLAERDAVAAAVLARLDAAKDPDEWLTLEEAARLRRVSPNTFKDSGAADDIPWEQAGKGKKREHRRYRRKDVLAWRPAHEAAGNFDHSNKGVRLISSGSATTGDGLRKARASQIEEKLRTKQRKSTRT